MSNPKANTKAKVKLILNSHPYLYLRISYALNFQEKAETKPEAMAKAKDFFYHE